VSREVEDSNRRLLRARDAMDRAHAEPLDVRDPSGNTIRVFQPAEVARGATV
jgi:hypothetical protein